MKFLQEFVEYIPEDISEGNLIYFPLLWDSSSQMCVWVRRGSRNTLRPNRVEFYLQRRNYLIAPVRR